MAYSLYIERDSPITIDEWLMTAENIDELKILQVSGNVIGKNPSTGEEIRLSGTPKQTVVLWSSELKEWIKPFFFMNGRILIKPNDWDDPKSSLQKKSFELAEKLNAKIIGDNGEIFTN